MKIIINENCTGCKVCLKSCPYSAIDMVDKQAVINYRCTMCGACLNACKFEAIVIEDFVKRAKEVPLDAYRGVWVFAELVKEQIASVSLELLTKGHELAKELKTKLTAVIISADPNGQVEKLIKYGADEVILASKPVFAAKDDEIYAQVLAFLIEKESPEILLAGATPFGRSVIPRVAAKLQTGLTADCTGLSIDAKKRLLLQTRPAFGGNIMATIVCEDNRPQIATVRPHVFRAEQVKKPKGSMRKADLKGLKISSGVEHQALIKELVEHIKLADAEVIVSGGRGLKGKEGFKLMQEIADLLGGAVGASRAAVDAGWISYPHQVGQTGKTVAPKVYIACGISGAVQHLAGMQTSDCIIAVNKDPNAPIFDVAHYSIVGDLYQVVPEMIKAIKESRSASRKK